MIYYRLYQLFIIKFSLAVSRILWFWFSLIWILGFSLIDSLHGRENKFTSAILIRYIRYRDKSFPRTSVNVDTTRIWIGILNSCSPIYRKETFDSSLWSYLATVAFCSAADARPAIIKIKRLRCMETTCTYKKKKRADVDVVFTISVPTHCASPVVTAQDDISARFRCLDKNA